MFLEKISLPRKVSNAPITGLLDGICSLIFSHETQCFTGMSYTRRVKEREGAQTHRTVVMFCPSRHRQGGVKVSVNVKDI